MIDTKALRSRVLDLAIQGKLTEQLESDGTAEELFAQIQEEKQRLIKEGKIKKEKPLPPVADEEIPFEIPSSWKWVRLSDIGYTNIGLTYHPCDISEKGTLVIRSSNIKNGKMDYADKVFVNCSVKDNQYLQKNDIIICARNGSKALVGKNAIFDGKYENVAFGAFMAVFRTSFFQYVYIYFNTDSFKRYFSNDDSKQINQVTQAILKESVFPLPPLAEQKRIVERVEEIFKLLDIIDEAQAKYSADAETLKSKLITMGIQGKLTEQLESDGTAEELFAQIQEEKQRLIKEGKIKKEKPLPPVADEEIPFGIPSGWKWCRLADIGITVTGNTPSKKNPEYYGGDYPFFKPSDLDRGNYIDIASEYLSDLGKNISRQLTKGTILVSCIGNLGKCAIMNINGTTNQQINALTPILCNADYLLSIISSNMFKFQLEFVSAATTLAIVNKTKFDNCILPLPPLAEQKRIADKLDEILRVIG